MNKKDLIKHLICIIGGCICGYIATERVFSELIPIFLGTSGKIYVISVYLSLFGAVIGCICILELLLFSKLNRKMLFILYITYIVFLLICLFCRRTLESTPVLNPIIGLLGCFNNRHMLIQSALNLAAFIPLGWLFRNRGMAKSIGISFALGLAIEGIQYFFRLGTFDSFDIVLYVIGIMLGRYLTGKATKINTI